MLGLNEFRAIKPIDSVDDYESGLVMGETNAQKRARFVALILSMLKDKPRATVNEMVTATGASQGGLHGITTGMWEDGLVVREKGKTEGAIKPSWFYSLPE